jgi:CDP-4-dehydro-6-deoxyglucose reductase, E1
MMERRESIRSEIHSRVKEYYDLFLSAKRQGIPVSGKRYDEREINAIVDAALDGWWTVGKVTEEFERRFCRYLGAKHTIVVNSGSSANLLAMKALTSPILGAKRLKPGDEVVTVAAAFPTTVNPIIECGCVPVFCDIDLGTYNIDTHQLTDAITEKTKAVLLAHTLGNPFNIGEVARTCDKHGLWLIEDCCDALGSEYDHRRVGTFGDLATFSFYPAHHITMGEGGAVVTCDGGLAKTVRSMRDWGRDCWCRTDADDACKRRYGFKLGGLPRGYDHRYIYSEMGYNMKNTDLNVAIGLAQLDKLDGFVKARKANFNTIDRELMGYGRWFHLPKPQEKSDPSWFGYMLTIREGCGIRREELLKFLNKNGIGTRLLFAGNITKQPYFTSYKIRHKTAKNMENTDLVMRNSFWVGNNPLLDKDDMTKIARTIGEFVEKHKSEKR